MQYDRLLYTRAERLTTKKKISRASPFISKEIENGEGSNATIMLAPLPVLGRHSQWS